MASNLLNEPEAILEAALVYTGLGLPIIPLCSADHVGMSTRHCELCNSPGKSPVIKNWTALSTPTEDTVRSWYSRNANLNLGLILGDAGKECGWNLVGIDVDGEQAELELEQVSRSVLPVTWEFTTGRGRRLLYMLPEGAKSKKFKLKAKDGELAFLATGQQTVLPPSTHPSGKIYRWVDGRSIDEISIADAPQWLLNRVLLDEDDPDWSPPVEHQDWNRTVKEGERSVHLTRLAGSLIARGTIPKEQVLLFLKAWNTEHCDPPLTEDELVMMVNALYQSEKIKGGSKKGARSRKVLLPVPAAEQFLQRQKDLGYSWKYSTIRGLFYHCDDSKGPWEPVDTLLVQKLIRQQLVSEDESWDKMHYVNEVVNALREGLANESDANIFDVGSEVDFKYVYLENGMLDWKAGVLLPWDSDTHSTIQLPIRWDPQTAQGEGLKAWMTALREWLPDEESISFLQEFIGYCLVPDCSFRTAVFLYGAGSNGKSLFLDVISLLFGQHISFIPLHRIAERFETVGLLDKLVNICGDIDPRFIKETSVLKSVISGDTIRGEYKYGKSFHFTPSSRLIFSANALPKSQDRTYGWYSRWKYIEFPNRFSVNPLYKKRLLALLSQPESLSGLLCWAVAGLQRLYRVGSFTDSYAMKMSALSYRSENDNVVAFSDTVLNSVEIELVKSMAIKDRPRPLSLPSLYRLYNTWCADQGLKPASQSEFTRRLTCNCSFVKAVRPIGGRSTNCLINAELDPELEREYNMEEAMRVGIAR